MQFLGSTRSRILALVKERQRCHPDAIAAALELAPSSVRQHLTALQRDGYVEPVDVREGSGRPRREYRVTAEGDELFPKRYDELALTLLDAGVRPGHGYLLDAFVEEEVARHKGSVHGYDSRTRMEEVAELMRQDGGLAVVEDENGAVGIREPNCVYARIATANDAVCQAHAAIVERLVGVPVTFVRTSQPHLGGCRWLVERQPHAGGPEEGSANTP